MALHPYLITALTLLLALCCRFSDAVADCYYPDGSIALLVAPCSPEGGTCCPLNYQCLSNGLCYLDSKGTGGKGAQWDRNSCTDQTWQSDRCPQICTQNNTASGNEFMLPCNSNHDLWCCDGNGSWDCCNTAPQVFLNLDAGSSTATITSTPATATQTRTVHNSPATAAQGTTTTPGKPNAATSSHTSSKQTTHTSPASKASPSTITHKTTTTGKDGAVSTVTRLTTVQPSVTAAAASQGNPTNHSTSHLPFILGLALGIPLVLLLAAILAFILYRRHKKTKNYKDLPRAHSPPIEASYMRPPPPVGRAPELQGYPVAPGRTKSGKKSELEGSTPDTFLNSPTVSTSGTLPPQYSPGTPKPMASIPEQPQELWGGYVPFRPERPVEGGGGGVARPEMMQVNR